MKTLTKLLSIIVTIMLFQSCAKESSCTSLPDVVNTYNISADDKSKIPFKGNDTLVYISDAGDTATLIGTGKKEFIAEVRKNVSGNADCTQYIVDNNETINIEYNGNNPELYKLSYKIYGNKESTKIEFIINNYYGNTDPYYFNNITFYTDSISVGNKLYIGRPIVWLGVNTLLYNFSYGFLKIQINGGKIWLLKI